MTAATFQAWARNNPRKLSNEIDRLQLMREEIHAKPTMTADDAAVAEKLREMIAAGLEAFSRMA